MLDSGKVVQGRYRVVRLLGQGGMGSVYRAWDLRLKVPVALKELRPQPGLDAETLSGLREQFEQEASVLARLIHPHLVRVTDYFEEGGNAYLVMDFVDGRSLADLISKEGSQNETKTVEWTRQLLDALAYCHAQGVVHRDIKPQNIVLKPDGNVVLVDFGLVKLWDPNDPRTRTVMRGMGTPEYAPPEQYGVSKDHTGPPSDIYSLGATLYHLLTGRAPATATERMAIPETFVPLRQLAPHVSDRFEQLIMRALALSVSERWQSCRDMLAQLTSGPLPVQYVQYQTPPPPSGRTMVAPSLTGPGMQQAVQVPRGAPISQPIPMPQQPARAAAKGGSSARLFIGIGVGLCILMACLGYLLREPLMAWLDVAPTRTATPEVRIPAATSTPRPEGPAVDGFRITIDNASPDEVCYVQISPSESDQWGDDWLGESETIPPGTQRGFDVSDGTYDVLLQTCDASTMATGWRIKDDATVTVGEPGATVRLMVKNASTVEICSVHISSSRADDWGQDWLGDMESLPPENSRAFYVKPGTYDLQVSDCDYKVVSEEYATDLTEDTVWTLED